MEYAANGCFTSRAISALNILCKTPILKNRAAYPEANPSRLQLGSWPELRSDAATNPNCANLPSQSAVHTTHLRALLLWGRIAGGQARRADFGALAAN